MILRHRLQGQGQIPDLLIKRKSRPDVLNQRSISTNVIYRLVPNHSQDLVQGQGHTEQRQGQKNKKKITVIHNIQTLIHISSMDRYTPRHGNPRKHPKALRLDGKTNWLSFKTKFDSYRKVMIWTEEDSKDYLMWSLEGKALDFLTIIKMDLEKYSFRKIMKKTRDPISRKRVD